MEIDVEAGGRTYRLDKDNVTIQVMDKNHLLDHFIQVELVNDGTYIQPIGTRFYRELFEKNGMSFDEIAYSLAEEGVAVIRHQDIPEPIEDSYVRGSMAQIDAEWAFWDKELH